MGHGRETVGDVLREWRGRRRISQFSLAIDAEISSRHLSFVESGRAQASRDMLLHLGRELNMPARACNRLLLAGGYAPDFADEGVGPQLGEMFEAVVAILEGHLPYPAVAVDRHWNVVRGNAALQPLLALCNPDLLTPPVNVLRLSLHPDGLASRIVNYGQWHAHVLHRLQGQLDASGDAQLAELAREIAGYPMPARAVRSPGPVDMIAVPLQLDLGDGTRLNLVTATTVFGTATEVSLSELVIECFFPADAATREFFLPSGK